MIAKRLENFRKHLKELNLDAALISNDYNRNYLTGFTGDESYILITEEKAYFITDSRYTLQAKEEVKQYDVLEYKNNIEEFINNLLIENSITSVGIEEDYVTLKTYELYKNVFKNVKIAKLGSTIKDLRVIKDEHEIELISKAAEIADKAFNHILSFIKVGVSEIDIAIELEFYMKKLGASGLSFTSIVASGVRSALPHGIATSKKIEKGDFVTLDFGCIYKGYCSDMTRTVVVGNATPDQKEIYNIVLNANIEALKCIKPGIKCFELDSIARDIIIKGGYGDNFGHGLGHGVGAEIHESPRVSPKSQEILKPGMVITDEPGIYIEGFGGVRIEDLVVVTDNGYKVLSNSPKELIEIQI